MKLKRRVLLAGGAGTVGAVLAERAVAGNGGAAVTTDERSNMFDTLRAAGPRVVAGEGMVQAVILLEGDFRWRGGLSTDDGSTWRLREDHHMPRMPRA